MFFRCKVTIKSRNMQIFGSKKPSAATSATLLPPFLPPLNYMKIRLIDAKVAVKSIISLVRGYWVKELLGYSVDKWIGCSNVIRIGYINVKWIGCSVYAFTIEFSIVLNKTKYIVKKGAYLFFFNNYFIILHRKTILG